MKLVTVIKSEANLIISWGSVFAVLCFAALPIIVQGVHSEMIIV